MLLDWCSSGHLHHGSGCAFGKFNDACCGGEGAHSSIEPVRYSGPIARQTRTNASMAEVINKKNAENPVMIYSKSYCPYCSQVKSFFADMEVSTMVVELDQLGVLPSCHDP
jgi:hypothetical protein